MKRAPIVILLAFAALPLGGCGGTMVREGVWEITWNIQESSTRLPWNVPKRTVQVRVEKDSSGEGEIVEISPLDVPPSGTTEERNPAMDIRPMYGDVRVRAEDEPASIQIESADAYWRWVMWGVVRSSEYITGTHFGARLRQSHRSVVLEGWWTMRWLRET
jgi:hypothetical protein